MSEHTYCHKANEAEIVDGKRADGRGKLRKEETDGKGLGWRLGNST